MFIAEHTLESSDPTPGRSHLRLASGFAQAYFLAGLLYATGGLQLLPAFLRMAMGGFVFCMGPGLALYSLLSLRRPSRFSWLTLLVLSCSLGFTFNFFWNLVVYVLGLSIAQASSGYLVVTTAIYGWLLARWWRRGEGGDLRLRLRDWLPALGILTGLVIYAWLFSAMQPAGFYVEELMVLRKIFENPQISPNNISFQWGAHTTYYFIPFYLMIAMTAWFAGVDVLQAVAGLWPFTAAVSLLCLVVIARLLAGGWTAALILAVAGLLGAFLFPHPTSNLFTLVAPFPDRYALAAGVLIPLALFHFLVHVGEEKVSTAAFVGLVYLIVEITFIHARETLFFIAIVLVCAAMAAVDLRANRGLLRRIASLVGVVGAVLVAYRLGNLALQPELNAFIGRLREDMVIQLAEGLAVHSWPALFGIPQFHDAHVADAFAYDDRFGMWRQYGEIGFLPLVIALLPLYAWLVQRPALLLAPTVVALFGLFSLFQGLRLAIGIAVGAPFVFDIFSVMFLLAALVLADLLRMAATMLVAPGGVTGGRGDRWMVLAVAAGLLSAWYWHNHTAYATGGPYTEMLLYLLTLGIVLQRLLRWRRAGASPDASGTDFSRGIPERALRLACLSCLASPSRIALAGAALTSGTVLYVASVQPGQAGMAGMAVPILSRPYSLDGSLADNLRRLDERRLFAVSAAQDFALPQPIVKHIRDRVPPRQIWFGSHTAGVMLVSSQYSPVVSFGGAMEEGFEANNDFLAWFHGASDRKRLRESGAASRASFGQLMEDSANRPRLLEFLDREKVGWIITIPADRPRLTRLFADEPGIARRLAMEAEADGYAIYRFLPD